MQPMLRRSRCKCVRSCISCGIRHISYWHYSLRAMHDAAVRVVTTTLAACCTTHSMSVQYCTAGVCYALSRTYLLKFVFVTVTNKIVIQLLHRLRVPVVPLYMFSMQWHYLPQAVSGAMYDLDFSIADN
jgi:hypothetical protein